MPAHRLYLAIRMRPVWVTYQPRFSRIRSPIATENPNCIDNSLSMELKLSFSAGQLIIGQFRYAPNLVEDERLREIDFGVLDGLTKHGIAHFQPGEQERRARIGKYHHRPSGGENYPDVALRLHSFLSKLTRKAVGRSVLVVCHSVVVLVFRKLLERLSEHQLLTIDADKTQEVRNCSVTHY